MPTSYIMQANTSYVVLDPKGEILRDMGYLLERYGYDIKVLDLIHTERSHGFNPFVYLRDDKDVLRLVNNLIRNTTPKGAQSSDPFWERAETALLEALILYLVNEAPPEEQNFSMVMEMINAAEVREDDEEYASVLDELFERLAMRDPEHLAVKQYHIFKLAAGVVCSKRLLNQAVGKSLRTHNLKPKKGAQVMRKNEKITALYERLSRDDFGKDDDQQRESNSISNQKAMLEEFAARQGFTNIVHFTDDGIIPNIVIRKTKPIGHYGRLRKAYLEMHRPILFNELVLSDKLFEHCAEIDEAARNRMELIVRSLAEQNGVTEQLKAENQMEWVRQMNACKAQAEEVVKAELIYD